MINYIKKWLKERKEKKKLNSYLNGFDFAAGVLLRREQTPIQLDSLANWQDANDFDLGMDAAIDVIVGLNFVEDNRI